MKVCPNLLRAKDMSIEDAKYCITMGYNGQLKHSSNMLETDKVIVFYRGEHECDSSFRGFMVDHLWFDEDVSVESREHISRLVKVRMKEPKQLDKNILHVYEVVEQVGEVSTTYRTTDKQTFMEIFNRD